MYGVKIKEIKKGSVKLEGYRTKRDLEKIKITRFREGIDFEIDYSTGNFKKIRSDKSKFYWKKIRFDGYLNWDGKYIERWKMYKLYNKNYYRLYISYHYESDNNDEVSIINQEIKDIGRVILNG